MERKLGQEPAFPYVEELIGSYGTKYDQVTHGMSKRFYAACCAMQGILANVNWDRALSESSVKGGVEITAKAAYAFADELLKQENQ